jgi:hypothetical protein
MTEKSIMLIIGHRYIRRSNQLLLVVVIFDDGQPNYVKNAGSLVLTYPGAFPGIYDLR